jgi:pimeloyl-ACP methyl ester carboxylesterase
LTTTDHPAEPEALLTFPGARRPDRRRTVVSHGLRLAVWEWGAEDAPPVLLMHGGFDFAGTFDQFAPRLADAGWRVVAWDQRGHGDSDHSVLYSWDADVRDGLAVLDTLSAAPIPLIGHSKGGALVVQLADALPFRCSHAVNLDGLPSRRMWQDISDHERRRIMAGEVRSWLDHRRASADRSRNPGTIDELARRRQRMNARLPLDWLRYLVPIGARQDPDGWRWKIDPSLRFGRFGPWRPEWAMERVSALGMPMLAVLGLEVEEMGWGTLPEDVVAYLPSGARFETLDGVGHFVHVEAPQVVADLVLDFLGPPGGPEGAWAAPEAAAAPDPGGATPDRSATVELVHNRARLGLHRLRDGTGRSLLLLHGLGERSPDAVPENVTGWRGPVWALDFTGHGTSDRSTGGGYTPEILMADADAAVDHLGTVTVLGRGLGAYVALQLAGARPDLVVGAILADGPGILGGGPGPHGTVVDGPAETWSLPAEFPDAFALIELARDPRPPEYAASFAHLAVEGATVDPPIAVVAVARPDWLAGLVQEPGVEEMTLEAALARYG